MSDAGYTLAETLAALLIIGLAFAGLAEATRVIGLFQSSTSRTIASGASQRAVQASLDRLLAGAGPFRSDDRRAFSGDDHGFRFDCDRPSPCGASVIPHGDDVNLSVVAADGHVATTIIHAGADAAFSYEGERGRYGTWPPAAATTRERLRSILLVRNTGGSETPLAIMRLWKEQETHCQFDPIAEDCRAAAS